jgi:hypothetical protein
LTIGCWLKPTGPTPALPMAAAWEDRPTGCDWRGCV